MTCSGVSQTWEVQLTVPDLRERTAWLLLSVGDKRQHGGNSGYDDQADLYYSWDSTVPNSAEIKPGDAVVIWDKVRLLGVSVVEEITEDATEKLRFKCPHCGLASFKARQTKPISYRCFKCKGIFDAPVAQLTPITKYRSRHDAAWTPLEGLILGAQLRQLCYSPKSQLSMRPLRWDAFQEVLSSRGANIAVDRVAKRAPDFVFPQGHRYETVRVRRGQQAFREHLLGEQGQVCAFTGEAPAKVLEAGHLYSYAELGVHHQHGGLLLRRDIHRLFDDGSLAVDPMSFKVDVSASLDAYPQYTSLHDRKLFTRLRDPQVEWLAAHWAQYRPG